MGQPEASPGERAATAALERCRQLEAERDRLRAELHNARRFEAASRALQATIDDLEGAQGLDELVPRALKIAVDAFGARACMYFEHGDVGPIRLRCGYREGRVLTSPDWPDVDPDQSRFIGTLFGGFQVGAEHLGVDPVQRTFSVALDHRTANSWPAAHVFAVGMGWPLELNVPLVVNGLARGAITIYREATSPFRPQEHALAETLARQVAIAMQAARVAEETREQALARERAAAAARRLHEAERAATALQRATDALSGAERLEEWIPRMLQVITESFGVRDATCYEHPGDTVCLRW